jgi:hypothetical protein
MNRYGLTAFGFVLTVVGAYAMPPTYARLVISLGLGFTLIGCAGILIHVFRKKR